MFWVFLCYNNIYQSDGAFVLAAVWQWKALDVFGIYVRSFPSVNNVMTRFGSMQLTEVAEGSMAHITLQDTPGCAPTNQRCQEKVKPEQSEDLSSKLCCTLWLWAPDL